MSYSELLGLADCVHPLCMCWLTALAKDYYDMCIQSFLYGLIILVLVMRA